jgi:hypothetical protein
MVCPHAQGTPFQTEATPKVAASCNAAKEEALEEGKANDQEVAMEA